MIDLSRLPTCFGVFPATEQTHQRLRLQRIVLGLLVLALLGESRFGHTAQTVYRCQSQGQIVLTDQPCTNANAPESSGVTIPSKRDPSTVGRWQGQLQYSGSESGEMIESAHSVVSLELEFTPDGK